MKFSARDKRHDFDIAAVQEEWSITVSFSGYATAERVAQAIGAFRETAAGHNRLSQSICRRSKAGRSLFRAFPDVKEETKEQQMPASNFAAYRPG